MSPNNYLDIFTRLTGTKRIEAVTMLIQNINGLEEIDVLLRVLDLQLKNTTSDNDGFRNNLMEEKVTNVKDSYEVIHNINFNRTISPTKGKSLEECTVEIEQLKYSENKLDKDTYFIDKNPYINHDGEFHRDRNEKINSKNENVQKKTNLKQTIIACSLSIKPVREFRQDEKEKVNQKQKDDKSFSCEFCGKLFKDKQNMTFHENRHKGIFKLSCSTCEYKTNKKRELDRHMNIHTHKENFSCDLCGKRFNFKEGLTMHKKKHIGTFDFSCNTCEYKANNKSNFRRHVNSHLNLKPYACPVCKVRSARKDKLKNHVRKKHKANGTVISKLEALYPQMYNASEIMANWRSDPLFKNMVMAN